MRPENFSTNPLPLRRIYVITADDSVAAGEVQRLDPLAALGYLRTHTYCPRVLDLLGETAVRRNFQDCATLLSGVEVYALGRPAGLQQLSQVLDGLEQDWCNAAADSAMLGQGDR